MTTDIYTTYPGRWTPSDASARRRSADEADDIGEWLDDVLESLDLDGLGGTTWREPITCRLRCADREGGWWYEAGTVARWTPWVMHGWHGAPDVPGLDDGVRIARLVRTDHYPVELRRQWHVARIRYCEQEYDDEYPEAVETARQQLLRFERAQGNEASREDLYGEHEQIGLV